MISEPTSVKKFHRMKNEYRKKYKYFIVQNFMRKKYFLPSDNPYTEKELALLKEYIQEYKPDFVCLSVQSNNFNTCCLLTQLVRDLLPETQIIWGGIVPTYEPEEALQYADIACRGEGEYPILELAQNPSNTNIKNLCFKTNGGKNIVNSIRPLLQDLDQLPFPEYGKDEFFIEDDRLADLFQEVPQMLNNHIYIQTSRGCAYQCSYCHNSYLKRKIYPSARNFFRQRSVDNVMKQLDDYCHEYNLQYALFTDEIFIKNERWIEEFAQKYPRLGIPFGGYCHPSMTSEKMLQDLKDIGMKQVAMGIQSGSERILKNVYHRYFGLNPIKRILEIFDRLQFDYVRYDLIVNNPFEKEDDYLKTFDLLLNINHTFDLALFDLELFPYTELSEMDIPEHSLSIQEREAWIILFLMTTIQNFPRNVLRSMAKSSFLKKHPEILRAIGFLFRNDDVLPEYFVSYEPYKASWKKAAKNLTKYLFTD